MNEALQNTINTILTEAMAVAEATGEFLVDQVPDVVEQLLVWHLTVSLIGMCLFILIHVISVKLIVKHMKDWFFDLDGPDRGLISTMGGSMYAIYMTVTALILSPSLDWLKIWIAPKLYLLEYAADLVSK